jgi:hypothetical protein
MSRTAAMALSTTLSIGPSYSIPKLAVYRQASLQRDSSATQCEMHAWYGA